jgi:ABC-2 type transport system permease protein
MNFTRSAAIVLRQYYLLSGSPVRVVPTFAWVAIDMILWGFMTRYLNTVALPGFNFISSLLGAVLLWDFFTRVMHGVTMAFLEDLWSRNFLNFFATPLSISEYLTGLVVTGTATACIGLVTMLILASAIFGLSFLAYGALFIPFLLILFMFGIALGIVGCAIVLHFGPAAEWFIWPMPALISPFAGVFYPLATLPPWMRAIARAFPPSYVFEGIRSLAATHTAEPEALFNGAALAVVDILLACWLFTRVYKRAVRIGLIARYSAESVS